MSRETEKLIISRKPTLTPQKWLTLDHNPEKTLNLNEGVIELRVVNTPTAGIIVEAVKPNLRPRILGGQELSQVVALIQDLLPSQAEALSVPSRKTLEITRQKMFTTLNTVIPGNPTQEHFFTMDSVAYSKIDRHFLKRVKKLIQNSNGFSTGSRNKVPDGLVEFSQLNLISQYLLLQQNINSYILNQYPDNEVHLLQHPHGLYEPIRSHKEIREREYFPREVEIVCAPNSEYVAVRTRELLEFRKVNASQAAQNTQNNHTALSRLVLRPGERIAFTPDSEYILVYSALSIKLISIFCPDKVYETDLSMIEPYLMEGMDFNIRSEYFNEQMCFGRFHWQLSDNKNHYKFIFWSPFFVYTFYYDNQNLDRKQPNIQYFKVGELPTLLKDIIGHDIQRKGKHQTKCCSAGNNNFMVMTEIDRKTVVYMGRYELTSTAYDLPIPSSNFADWIRNNPLVGSISNLGDFTVTMKLASYELYGIPQIFDLEFKDVPLSTVCCENRLELDMTGMANRKLFFDSRVSKVAEATFKEDGLHVEHYFSVDSEVRFITAFNNRRFFAIVWQDAHITFYMLHEEAYFVVMRSYVDKCQCLANSPDCDTLFIVTENAEEEVEKKLNLEIVLLNLPQIPMPQKVADIPLPGLSNAECIYLGEDSFLCLASNEQVPMLYHYKQKEKYPITIDPRSHPKYMFESEDSLRSIANLDPASHHKRQYSMPHDNAAKPEQETSSRSIKFNKLRFDITVHDFAIKRCGIVFYMTVRDRETNSSGKFIKAIRFETMEEIIVLDTLDSDKIYKGPIKCHVNELFTTTFLITEESSYFRQLTSVWEAMIPIVPAQNVSKIDNSANLTYRSTDMELNPKKSAVIKGDFFEHFFQEFVDVEFDTEEVCTRVNIYNSAMEVKASTSIRIIVNIKNAYTRNEKPELVLWGREGLLIANRNNNTFNWITASSLTKIADSGNIITKAMLSPDAKYLVLSFKTPKKMIKFVAYSTLTLERQDMLTEPYVKGARMGTEWDFTTDSVYWLYASGHNKTIYAYNFCLQHEMHSIDMYCPMDVKFLRVTKLTVDLVGFILPPALKGEPLSHSYFRIRQNLQPFRNSLLPLIQHQMIQHCITDYSDRRLDCMRTIEALLDAVQPHLVGMNPIYMIMMFFMNHGECFERFSKRHMPLAHMLENLSLMRLFFSTNKRESTQVVVRLMDEYVDTYQEYPFLDEQYIQQLIIDGGKFFMRNAASQSMMRRLLFSFVCETPPIELSHEYRPMTYLRRFDKENIKSNVISDSYSVLLSRNQVNPLSYNVFETRIKLDLRLGSNFSIAFFNMVSKIPDKDLAERYYVMVYYKWHKIFIYAFVYTMLYWIMTVMYYYYFGYAGDFSVLGPWLIAMSVFFLIFEAKCAYRNFLLHFSNLWNTFDVLIHVLAIFLNIKLAYYRTAGDQQFVNWMRAVVCMGVCVRSLTFLKIFRMTRYIISMILRVFTDLLPFLFILLAIIFMFALIWKISPSLALNSNGLNELTFYQSIQVPFNIIFGNSPTEDETGAEFDVIRFIILLAGNMVLAVTMMNFLIAIITSCFEAISEKRHVYDAKALLGFIQDWDAFFAGFTNHKNIPRYYISLIKKKEEGERKEKKFDAKSHSGSTNHQLRNLIEDIIQTNMSALSESNTQSVNHAVQVLQATMKQLLTGDKLAKPNDRDKAGMFKSIFDTSSKVSSRQINDEDRLDNPNRYQKDPSIGQSKAQAHKRSNSINEKLSIQNFRATHN